MPHLPRSSPALAARPRGWAVVAAALVLSGGATLAQPARQEMALTVASFNMAWAGTPDDYAQHLQVCSAPSVNWCDTRARWMPGTTQASPEETARAKACEAATMAAAGGREASMKVAPCNAYRDGQPRVPGSPPPDLSAMRQPAAYEGKLAGLRATVEALIEGDKVRLIAFQEVKSEAAVRLVLGRFADRFEVCAAAASGFQSVAFAWDKALSSAPAQCTVNSALAILDPAHDPQAFRRVRPGLALQLNVGGAPVTFLNIHLKAGCASVTQSNPRFPGRLLTDAVEPCEVFNRQVPLLEGWIDEVASRTPNFVVIGDWNRRIDDEQTLAIAKDQVRSDGSDPASPHRVGADGRAATRYLWPEISDGAPQLFQLPLRATAAECRGWTGLDHIVVSAALHARLAAAGSEALGSRKVAVVNRPGQLIETTDHCPLLATLRL